MRCRDVRKQLGIYSYLAYSPEQLSQALQAHLDACPACRMWLERIRRVSDMVRGLPPRQVSEDFTERVLGGLRHRRVGPVQGLLAGLFGPLRAPVPLVPASQALAVACLLLVLLAGGGLYAAHNGRSSNLDGPGGVVVADGLKAPGAAMPIAVGPVHFRPVSGRHGDLLGVEDLILRHENYEMNKPLATDPGIRLVRDSGY